MGSIVGSSTVSANTSGSRNWSDISTSRIRKKLPSDFDIFLSSTLTEQRSLQGIPIQISHQTKSELDVMSAPMLGICDINHSRRCANNSGEPCPGDMNVFIEHNMNSSPQEPGMEARAGIEPAWAALQTAAWPLCYRADENPDEE